MADAIRVNCDGKWTYAPAGGVVQSRLERLAKAGMASFSNGTAQLRSDAGPLLWDLINRNEPLRHDCKTAALRALGKNCINLTPNEKLVFGKREGCSYDEFSDLSLAKGEPDIGIKVGITPLKDKQIVMTAWPSSGTLIPARVQIAGRTIWLRLVEPQDEGQRCFVLDDKCGSFLTVSQKTDGGDAVRAMNPKAVTSWLCSEGSSAALSNRFMVEPQGGKRFSITCRKTGKRYAGELRSDPNSVETVAFEILQLSRMLASKGLGAILGSYKLLHERDL